MTLDYASLLQRGMSQDRLIPERASGCGRVYIVLVGKDHVKGIEKAASALNMRFQRKGAYGLKNALYVGYDNATGKELAQGTRLEQTLKSAGIECYRDEFSD